MQRIDFHYAFVWPKRVDNLSRFLAETVAGHDYVVGDGLGKMLKYLSGKQIRFPGGPAWPFSIAPKWLADHPCVSDYFVQLIATGAGRKTNEEMCSELTYRPALNADEEVIGALVWWACEPERIPWRPALSDIAGTTAAPQIIPQANWSPPWNAQAVTQSPSSSQRQPFLIL